MTLFHVIVTGHFLTWQARGINGPKFQAAKYICVMPPYQSSIGKGYCHQSRQAIRLESWAIRSEVIRQQPSMSRKDADERDFLSTRIIRR